MPSTKAFYSATISTFLTTPTTEIDKEIRYNNPFQTTYATQKQAWTEEIDILKTQLQSFEQGEIAFEYTIPRMGHRIDVVCLVGGIIFLLEFKAGDNEYRKSTDDQVMDYALDLKYFHEASRERYIVPISIPTRAAACTINGTFMEDGIFPVCHCSQHSIGDCIQYVLDMKLPTTPIAMDDWLNSRYVPTPTIIEAAQAMYQRHSVGDISRSEAGAENLTTTSNAIIEIIRQCRQDHKKAICFVTGVPGAGKTLAGLNIASAQQQCENEEHAVFLSGNDPLVAVLQEALARDDKKRNNIKLDNARRKTKTFIQNIYVFRNAQLRERKPPVEKVVIFDEAQRAWDRQSLFNFTRKNPQMPTLDQSEPECLIGIMDQHPDWAVIICLVGGGQEINKGEAGIAGWFETLRSAYPNWEIHLSDRMTDYEYIGNSSIENLLAGRQYIREPSLHLGVPLRSFRSEKVSAFVKSVLDNEPQKAAELYSEIRKAGYPIALARSLQKAKDWVRTKSRGNERYGILASSQAKRLRSVGIWVQAKAEPIAWFLYDKEQVNSSYYLESAATEFEVQGLEIDYGIVAWDADFRYCPGPLAGSFQYFRFGRSWETIGKKDRQQYLKNAYRVLLTRSRQGMVIFVPEGVPPEKDPTRRPEYYDGTYNYLKSIGIEEL